MYVCITFSRQRSLPRNSVCTATRKLWVALAPAQAPWEKRDRVSPVTKRSRLVRRLAPSNTKGADATRTPCASTLIFGQRKRKQLLYASSDKPKHRERHPVVNAGHLPDGFEHKTTTSYMYDVAGTERGRPEKTKQPIIEALRTTHGSTTDGDNTHTYIPSQDETTFPSAPLPSPPSFRALYPVQAGVSPIAKRKNTTPSASTGAPPPPPPPCLVSTICAVIYSSCGLRFPFEKSAGFGVLGVWLDEWKLRTANAKKCSSSRYARKAARATEELRRNTTAKTKAAGGGGGYVKYDDRILQNQIRR